MIIRLHNLSARVPTLHDTEAMTELLDTCDIAHFGAIDKTREDVVRAWQTFPHFTLETDAWTIVTRKGQLVGYADIRAVGTNEHLVCFVRIHPDFRGRGIGTLFTLLIEERARQLACHVHPDKRVTLSVTICSHNSGARHLLEREGYMLKKRIWHLTVTDGDTKETTTVVINNDNNTLFDPANAVNRTGFIVARKFEVYDKELRPNVGDCNDTSNQDERPSSQREEALALNL